MSHDRYHTPATSPGLMLSVFSCHQLAAYKVQKSGALRNLVCLDFPSQKAHTLAYEFSNKIEAPLGLLLWSLCATDGERSFPWCVFITEASVLKHRYLRAEYFSAKRLKVVCSHCMAVKTYGITENAVGCKMQTKRAAGWITRECEVIQDFREFK